MILPRSFRPFLVRRPFLPLGRSRRGMGTVEVVLIVAVLMTIALLFRSTLVGYARDLMKAVFGDHAVLTDVEEVPSLAAPLP